jgi:hypothetical protein
LDDWERSARAPMPRKAGPSRRPALTSPRVFLRMSGHAYGVSSSFESQVIRVAASRVRLSRMVPCTARSFVTLSHCLPALIAGPDSSNRCTPKRPLADAWERMIAKASMIADGADVLPLFLAFRLREMAGYDTLVWLGRRFKLPRFPFALLVERKPLRRLCGCP